MRFIQYAQYFLLKYSLRIRELIENPSQQIRFMQRPVKDLQWQYVIPAAGKQTFFSILKLNH